MYTSVFLMGGLGNQLFQIFTLLAYTKRYNKKPIIKYLDKLEIGITRQTYWNTFLVNLKKYTTLNDINLHIISETSFKYSKIPNIKHSFQLYGYFQSYKYFNDSYKAIKKEIGIDKMRLQLLNKHSKYFNKNKINVSMHFRIGDYKHQQHNYPIMPTAYYINSIKNIINKTNTDKLNVLYFCEKNDINDVSVTIKILNEIFHNITFVKVNDNIEDWKQMLLMSNCDHNIIANSTFSWWGAYFNSWPDKIVCYPSVWFGPALSHNTKDLCPPDWEKITA